MWNERKDSVKKSLFLFGAAAVLMLLGAGCASLSLPGGCYLPGDERGDYAIVYQKLIFLHMRAPENSPGQTAFWDWAGSYSIGDGGKLELDMDTQTRKLWDFYYNFRVQGGMILVDDLSTRNTYPLRIERQKLRNEVMQFQSMQ